MARIAAICLIVLCANAVAAHPFDDRCDMVCQVVLERDAKTNVESLSLRVQYRYETPYASYNEAYLSLDANRDQKVTRDELEARYKQLASDLMATIVLTVRDEPASIEPNYQHFDFANLDDPDASVDAGGGMSVVNLRIGYFFDFEVKFKTSFGPGQHPVQFYQASRRVTITDPDQQLQAWDDRKPERKAVTSVRYDTTPDKFDRLNFIWDIADDASSSSIPIKTTKPVEPEPVAPGKSGKQQLLETDKERHDPDSAESTISRAMAQLRDGKADPMVWLAVLATMFLIGSYHALMPGHGKTLVAGYLVGTRGRRSDALFLGIVVTAAHTSGVYLLLGGAWAAREIWPGVMDNPEKQIAEWIALAVGATIFLMGVGLIMKRTSGNAHHEHDIFGRHVHGDHGHDHPHASDEKHPEDSDILEEVHSHDHPHDHSHDHDHNHHHDGHTHDHGDGHHHHHGALDPGKMTRWEILRLGILGGVLPCPSAFVIGLLALQWQMFFSGLIAVLVFSLGLATVLATIGLMLVQSKEYLAKRSLRRGPIARFLEAKLPVFGALVITVIGVLIVVFAMIRLDLINPTKFTV